MLPASRVQLSDLPCQFLAAVIVMMWKGRRPVDIDSHIPLLRATSGRTSCGQALQEALDLANELDYCECMAAREAEPDDEARARATSESEPDDEASESESEPDDGE